MGSSPDRLDALQRGLIEAFHFRRYAVSCAEEQTLVDLKLLLDAGLTLAEVLQDAQQKHAGADPATLAWALGTWRIPPTAALPEDTTAAEIEAFRDDLVRQLALLALPKE